jgi:hypothetical protein
MRRRLGVLAGTTGLVLAASIVVAGPAEARRNVGGTLPEGSICVYPGGAQFQDPAKPVLPCTCVSILDQVTISLEGGKPGGACPSGLTRVRIDRNVGG